MKSLDDVRKKQRQKRFISKFCQRHGAQWILTLNLFNRQRNTLSEFQNANYFIT